MINRKSQILLTIALLVYLCLGFRQLDSPLGGTRKFTLANGLRVLVREQRDAPLVAIDLWIPAGSSYESRDQSGAAHFVEHLIFKGTKTRGPGEIDAAFEDVGSQLYAGTTREAVHFHATVAASYLPQSLETLSDAIRHSLLAPDEIERERAVIHDEVAIRSNDWRRAASDALHAAAYGDSAMGRPITGAAQSLRNLARAEILAFYQNHYQPSGASLAIVGAIDTDSARKAAEESFGGWSGRPGARAPVASGSTPTRESVITSTAGINVAAVGIMLPMGSSESDRIAATVIGTIIGDPRNGRLSESLRKSDRTAEAGAENSISGTGDLLMFFAKSSTLTPSALASAIEKELDRLMLEKLAESEVEWARRRIQGTYLFETETNAGQARLLGNHEIRGGYLSAVNYIDTVRSVTVAQVNAFILQHLVKERRVRATSKNQ